MADILGDLVFTLLIGVWIIAVPGMIFLFKDRLTTLQKILGNKVISFEVYEIDENSGWTPETELKMEHLKLMEDWKCYKIKQKGLIWLWISRGFLKGFKIDSEFWAFKKNDKGEAVIRILQKTTKIYEQANFMPIDIPNDIGIKRQDYEAQLSAINYEINQSADNEIQKIGKPDFLKELLLPGMLLLTLIMGLFLGYMHIESMAETQNEPILAALGKFTTTIQTAYQIEIEQNTTADNINQKANEIIPLNILPT